MNINPVAPNSLEQLYGVEVSDLALVEIQELAKNSNIPFDTKYMSVGISFMHHNADDILAGKKPEMTLKSLVGKSFEEAAICKYNIPEVYNK